MLNFNTFFILIQNDQNQTMKISRNFRLNTVTELDYFNTYQADSKNVLILVIRHFKSMHKSSEFEKVITSFAAVTSTANCNNINNISFIDKCSSTDDTILFNDIVMHNFSSNVTQASTNLVAKHFIL